MLVRHTQDGTLILNPKNNVWSNNTDESVLGWEGWWIRITGMLRACVSCPLPESVDGGRVKVFISFLAQSFSLLGILKLKDLNCNL